MSRKVLAQRLSPQHISAECILPHTVGYGVADGESGRKQYPPVSSLEISPVAWYGESKDEHANQLNTLHERWHTGGVTMTVEG